MKTFIYPLASSTVMGGVLFLLNKVLLRGNYSRILIMLEIVVGIVVYFISMVLIKGITREELSAIPGGNKLLRIFKFIK